MRRLVPVVVALVFVSSCASESAQSTTTVGPTSTVTLPPIPQAAVDVGTVTGYIAIHGAAPGVFSPVGDLLWVLEDANPNAQPTFSPAGSLAWAASKDGESVVQIRTSAGETTATVAPVVPFYFHWSPDGQTVAYLGSGTSGLIDLVTADLDGTTTSVDTGSPYYLDWAPDSKTIVGHVAGDTLRLTTLDGDQPPFDRIASAAFGAPQWTDAGVAWVGDSTSNLSAFGASGLVQTSTSLQIGDPRTGEAATVTDISSGVGFSFSGDRVAVLDGAPLGTLRVFDEIGDADSNDAITVGTDVLAYQWSPDGSSLAWLGAVSGGARWSVWTETSTVSFETHTPSSLFISTYWPFWDQYTRSHTIWSPDGLAIAYGAEEAAGDQIYVQVIRENQPAEPVAAGGFASWGPATFKP